MISLCFDLKLLTCNNVNLGARLTVEVKSARYFLHSLCNATCLDWSVSPQLQEQAIKGYEENVQLMPVFQTPLQTSSCSRSRERAHESSIQQRFDAQCWTCPSRIQSSKLHLTGSLCKDGGCRWQAGQHLDSRDPERCKGPSNLWKIHESQ